MARRGAVDDDVEQKQPSSPLGGIVFGVAAAAIIVVAPSIPRPFGESDCGDCRGR